MGVDEIRFRHRKTSTRDKIMLSRRGRVVRCRAKRPARFKPKFAGLIGGVDTDPLPPGMCQKGAQLAHARRALDGYLQLEPKRSYYFQHSREFWVSLARKRLIKALPPKTRRLRDL
jgi:hypothetical protein